MKNPLAKIIIKYGNGWAQAHFFFTDGGGFAGHQFQASSGIALNQAREMLRREIGVIVGPIQPSALPLTVNFSVQ